MLQDSKSKNISKNVQKKNVVLIQCSIHSKYKSDETFHQATHLLIQTPKSSMNRQTYKFLGLTQSRIVTAQPNSPSITHPKRISIRLINANFVYLKKIQSTL